MHCHCATTGDIPKLGKQVSIRTTPSGKALQFVLPSTMPFSVRLALSIAVAVCSLALVSAQELAPRAYLITPLHSNAITLSLSFYHGSANYNGVLPLNDATGTYGVPILSCYHSFGFFGQSGNVVASLPYSEGSFQGTVSGVAKNLYRSGLLDSVFRLSINLKGGPAMSPKEFVRWKQKGLLGASLKVMAPTGQYDPNYQNVSVAWQYSWIGRPQ